MTRVQHWKRTVVDHRSSMFETVSVVTSGTSGLVSIICFVASDELAILNHINRKSNEYCWSMIHKTVLVSNSDLTSKTSHKSRLWPILKTERNNKWYSILRIFPYTSLLHVVIKWDTNADTLFLHFQPSFTSVLQLHSRSSITTPKLFP